jgi:LPS export ABC transporter protein LptC
MGKLILLGLLPGLTMCKNSLQKVKEAAGAYEPSRESGKGVQMLYSEDGAVLMKLLAPQALRYEVQDPYIEFPKGVLITLLDSTGEITGILKSKYAITYENKDQTTFRDSVYVRNVRGDELFTEELVLDEGKDRIHSDRFVRIITPDEQIIGHGLESNQDFSRYRVLKITGTFAVQEDVPAVE